MAQTVLLTASKDDSEYILSKLRNKNINVLHVPLEVYVERTADDPIIDVLNRINSFENIVYSCKRNARFFLLRLKQFNKLGAVKDRLNLAFDEATFTLLAHHGISAVHPQNVVKAIDMVEVLLRLKRLGKTLYPCGSHKREDLPGLLKELDIPVTELDLFDLKGPDEVELATYQKELNEVSPDIIIFHSRRAVNRTLAAFPDLSFEKPKIIAADKGVTQKLKKKGIAVADEGEGNWESILGLIENL